MLTNSGLKMQELTTAMCRSARQAQIKAIGKRRTKLSSKWAQKLKSRHSPQASTQWNQKLETAGSKKALQDSLALKASRSNCQNLSAARYQRKRLGPKMTLGRPRKVSKMDQEALQVSFHPVLDHALLNQEARVIGARTHPGRFARKSLVKAASLRTIGGQQLGQVLLHISFSSLDSDVCWTPVEEAQAISDEADQIPPGPFRMDYQHFRTPARSLSRTS
jgi:hypothetical protein